jgi:hypothetical protein
MVELAVGCADLNKVSVRPTIGSTMRSPFRKTH